MIGKCPHCGIELKNPPFSNRETNEVMVTMSYRKFMDSGREIKPLEELGYCEVCKAKKEDVEEQNNLKIEEPTE